MEYTRGLENTYYHTQNAWHIKYIRVGTNVCVCSRVDRHIYLICPLNLIMLCHYGCRLHTTMTPTQAIYIVVVMPCTAHTHRAMEINWMLVRGNSVDLIGFYRHTYYICICRDIEIARAGIFHCIVYRVKARERKSWIARTLLCVCNFEGLLNYWVMNWNWDLFQIRKMR